MSSKRGSDMVLKVPCSSSGTLPGFVRTLRSSCRRGNKTRHPRLALCVLPSPRVKVKTATRHRLRALCAFASIEQPPDGFICTRPCAAWEATTLAATCAQTAACVLPDLQPRLHRSGSETLYFCCRHVAELIIFTIIFQLWHS